MFAGRYHSPVQSIDTDDDGSPVHAGTSQWSGSHSNVGLHYTDPKKKDKGKCAFAAYMLGGWKPRILVFNVISALFSWFDRRDQGFLAYVIYLLVVVSVPE